MIVKEPKTSMPRYGNYFLITEAPPEDDQPVEEIQPQTVDPTQPEDDETDFTNVGMNDDTPLDEVTPEDETDFTNVGMNDGTGETPETPEETPTDTETPEGETPPEEDGGEGGTEEIPNEDTTDDAADPEGDFTDVGMDDGGEGEDGATDDTTTDTGTDDTQGTDGEKKGPGLEYDSTRKYNLYKEYMSLYNAISNYITKLENNIRDDIQANQIIKEATNRLREIKDLTYDYMTIKFEISTYTQSLVFYQTLIVSVQMVFNLLANIQDEKEKKRETQDKTII